VRTRKKELDAISDALSRPAESVDDLAKDVWDLIDSYRRERDVYVVGVNYQGVGQFLFGPYESEAMANKDFEGRGNIQALKSGDVAKVFKVQAPSKIFSDTPIQGDLFDTR
jgi:hypothetical protein